MELKVRVNPRASRRRFRGMADGVLRFDLNSPPQGGTANRELQEMVAGLLGIPRSRVRITRGEKSRDKSLMIEGMNAETLKGLLRLGGGESEEGP